MKNMDNVGKLLKKIHEAGLSRDTAENILIFLHRGDKMERMLKWIEETNPTGEEMMEKAAELMKER